MIHIYHCGGSQADLEVNGKMMRQFQNDEGLWHANWKCDCKDIRSETCKRPVDSGFAAISQALYVLYSGFYNSDMSESHLHLGREIYTWMCSESAEPNQNALAKTLDVRRALE